MNRTLFSIFGILLLFLLSAGCTLEDETVRFVVTGQEVVEPTNETMYLTGVINLTVYNDYSEDLKLKSDFFSIKGQTTTANNTHPFLFITNFTILDNGTETVGKGDVRKVKIQHILFINVVVEELRYDYKDLEITVDLTGKDRESEVVVQPSIFKTNYFMFAVVFTVSIVLLAILLGRSRPEPVAKQNVCKFCLDDLSNRPESEKIYCKKWRTRTRRCGEGPFCSERCLKYHQEDVSHES